MVTENRDTTIADIHRIRREIASQFNGVIFAISADAQARSESSGRQIIRQRVKSSQAIRPSGTADILVDNPSSAAGWR